ncbi:hypothetical protein [Salinigranum marinum]|uniref:hypothetical protein n=1 Tax=Salinigranum marinum TaxID=1515595 RepID=UPI002989AE2D|nr:hypothetical protein [Salinigranum marinum]
MAKNEWKIIGFRLPEIQQKQLDRFIEQSEYDSKQEYLHEVVLEDIRDVTLDDPRDELEEIRRQKAMLRNDIEEASEELKQMRDRLNELDDEEAELAQVVDEQQVAGAESYEEAVREVADRVVENEHVISENWEVIQRVSERWREEPIDVLRDVYILDPRITERQASPFKSQVVPEDWEKRVGDTREEAINLVRLYCETHKDDEGRLGDGIYVEDPYIKRVASAHDETNETLLRAAIGEMDEEYEEIVYDLRD